jgi:hypothetical protein
LVLTFQGEPDAHDDRFTRRKSGDGDRIGARDRITGGLVRGLKSRNVKTVPVHEWPLRDWLDQYVSKERQLSGDPVQNAPRYGAPTQARNDLPSLFSSLLQKPIRASTR